jgi:hypothetical protein
VYETEIKALAADCVTDEVIWTWGQLRENLGFEDNMPTALKWYTMYITYMQELTGK